MVARVPQLRPGLVLKVVNGTRPRRRELQSNTTGLALTFGGPDEVWSPTPRRTCGFRAVGGEIRWMRLRMVIQRLYVQYLYNICIVLA